MLIGSAEPNQAVPAASGAPAQPKGEAGAAPGAHKTKVECAIARVLRHTRSGEGNRAKAISPSLPAGNGQEVANVSGGRNLERRLVTQRSLLRNGHGRDAACYVSARER